jgi:hypothetical protein
MYNFFSLKMINYYFQNLIIIKMKIHFYNYIQSRLIKHIFLYLINYQILKFIQCNGVF